MGSIREHITWRHQWSRNLAPGGGLVLPELLEVLLEQIGTNALEVVAHQIFQFHFLVGGEVRRPLEKAPPRLGQDRFVPVRLHAPGFGGADVVERLVYFGHDVEPVEDIERLGTHLADHPQVGFPHVRTDELNLRRYLGADHGKEFPEGLHGPFPTNPQQPGTAQVDLIHQGQIFVPFAALNLVYANGANRPKDAMLQPPGDQILHRVAYLIPGSSKFFGGFLPGEFARPMSQKMHVNFG